MAVYKVIEVIGTSDVSWEDAASQAVARAGQPVADIRIDEVVSQDLKIEAGKVVAYRTKLSLSFKFREGSWGSLRVISTLLPTVKQLQ